MSIEDPDLRSPNFGREVYRPSHEPDRDFEYEILAMLEDHGAREGSALAAYQQVATKSTAGEGVMYLVRMILEDEERHHRVFGEMANSLKSFVEEVPVEPSVPAMAPRPDPELLAQTKKLLAFEKEDAKELRRLRRALKGAPKSMMHPLLVEVMLHDTEKHIAILEHIKSRLSGR